MDSLASELGAGSCGALESCVSLGTTIELEGNSIIGQDLHRSKSSTGTTAAHKSSTRVTTSSLPTKTSETTIITPTPSPTSSPHTTLYNVKTTVVKTTTMAASTSIIVTTVASIQPPLMIPEASGSGYTTTVYSSTTMVDDSLSILQPNVSFIMMIVGAISVLLVIVGAVVVVRPYRRRSVQNAIVAEDTEALATRSSREEMREIPRDVQDTTPSENQRDEEFDPAAIFAFRPPSPDENSEWRGERTSSAALDHHPQPPSTRTSVSRTISEDHHESDLDTASFHTTRGFSPLPDSLAPRPLPPIPRSYSGPSGNTTISPGASPQPMVSRSQREAEAEVQAETHAEEPRPSRRWSDADGFRREVRHRDSRTGLSTAHSQSTTYSVPPPSYHSARLPAYPVPDEEIPPLPGHYQSEGGYGSHG